METSHDHLVTPNEANKRSYIKVIISNEVINKLTHKLCTLLVKFFPSVVRYHLLQVTWASWIGNAERIESPFEWHLNVVASIKPLAPPMFLIVVRLVTFRCMYPTAFMGTTKFGKIKFIIDFLG